MKKETLQELLYKRQLDKVFKQKVTKVRRKIRKAMRIPIFNRTAYQKAILLDVGKMYEDMLDYLILKQCEFNNESEYLAQVALYLDFERVSHDHSVRLTYEVGSIEKVIILILKQHEYLDFKERIFNN